MIMYFSFSKYGIYCIKLGLLIGQVDNYSMNDSLFAMRTKTGHKNFMTTFGRWSVGLPLSLRFSSRHGAFLFRFKYSKEGTGIRGAFFVRFWHIWQHDVRRLSGHKLPFNGKLGLHSLLTRSKTTHSLCLSENHVSVSFLTCDLVSL